MNRRQFLRTSSLAGVAVTALPGQAAAAAPQLVSPKEPIPARANDPSASGFAAPQEIFGMGKRPAAQYFTEEKLYQELGTRSLEKPAVQVVAYNFPAYHPTPYMEKIFGKGWTEYDLLKRAQKVFPDHTMPHYPLFGFYDESDPVWAAHEIELASTYGVDAWMVDWYWHQGTQFYHEQIENGLLRAENRDKIKFAVMWANHDWKNYFPAESPNQAAMLLPQIHTIKDCENVANYCAEKYFSQSNYLRLDGKPVFGVFDVIKVITQLGMDGTKRAFAAMRERAEKLGAGGLHLQASNGYRDHETDLRGLGFDSATNYGTFGWTYGSKPPRARLPYGIGVMEGITAWKKHRAKLDIPYFPVCSSGWDDSARFGENSGIAINRSPDQFERAVQAARHFAAQNAGDKLIYICAWNEWTEDSVLLPDTVWGFSYLEALRRAAKL